VNTTATPTNFELHISVETESVTPVELLATHTNLSRQHIKNIMQQGAVWLTRKNRTERVRRAKRALRLGDELHLYYNKSILDQIPGTPLLIADKGGYSIWFKPFGMLCQGSKWGDHCTINRWVENHQFKNRPSIIIHRLDRTTTGLIILIHKKALAQKFSNIFQKRTITKRYRAIVEGEFPTEPAVCTINTPIEGRHATSHVKRLSYNSTQNLSLVEVDIETGRKHQIREHLSSIGWPIQGDRRFGANDTTADTQLSAVYLSFHCPIEGRFTEFLVPDDLLLRL